MNKKRLLKTISWEITATSLALVIFRITTGSWTIGIASSLLMKPVMMSAYYLHDKVWDRKR